MEWNRSLPNGTKDKMFKEATISHELEELVNNHFKNRGYQRIETPLVEFEEVFDALDQRHSTRYRFFDEQGRIVVLRPDMTLPIGRVISTTGIIPPVKLYYSGKIFRMSKDNSGEYNEQLQAGMELIGFDSLKAETECIINAIKIAKNAGLDNFQIEISHALIFKTIVRKLEMTKQQQEQFKYILQSKNTIGIQQFLTDFSDNELFDLIMRLPRLFGSVEILDELAALTTNLEILDAINEMKELIHRVKRIYPKQILTVDIGAVQEFSHYTGITFKGYSDNSPDYFLSGGRYDDLLTAFSAEPIPAVGIVFFLDRVAYINERKKTVLKPINTKALIHYDGYFLKKAEEILEKEPYSSLSLYEDIEESISYAKKWKIPRVIIINESEIKDIFLDKAGE